MNWCKTCILPDTRPNLFIPKNGKCNACEMHEKKKVIDWDYREKIFRKLVKKVKLISSEYDCIIPVSGGKDSTWQTIKCLEYGLKPLAVTWKTPGRTEIGTKNLSNLISLGVDHIDYQINPKIESRFMLKTFKKLGSTAIPMHLALFNIPLRIASRFKIPLVVWGENSAFEYGSKKKNDTGFKLDNNWIKTYGVTHGTSANDWIDKELDKKSLTAYFGPSQKEMRNFNLSAVFLGYYFSWDPKYSKKVAQKKGFLFNTGSVRTGYYDFADIDDDFISLHHWMKWYKFGFTRVFDNLSIEIRNKRISRETAINLLKKIGNKTPSEDIKKFCKFVGIRKSEFFKIAESFRNKKIWKKKNNKWYIPNFIIDDWYWE